MTAKMKLSLSGEIDHLAIVWQLGEILLHSLPFGPDPEGTRYNILVAVQEMVTNVLRHAYAGAAEQPMEVEFSTDARGVTIVVRDRGPAFDPGSVADQRTRDEDFPSGEGGYGILIARTVMDEIEHTREGDWNVLRLFKATQSPVVATTSEDPGGRDE